VADREGAIVSPPVCPGAVGIRARIADSDLRVIGIAVAGEPVTPERPINCATGQDVRQLEVRLGTDLGIVAGRVVSAEGMAPRPGVWVHIEPGDDESIRIAPVETDQSGSFMIHSVPAGPYALTSLHSPNGTSRPAAKRKVTVEPGEVVHIDLVLRDD